MTGILGGYIMVFFLQISQIFYREGRVNRKGHKVMREDRKVSPSLSPSVSPSLPPSIIRRGIKKGKKGRSWVIDTGQVNFR